MIYGTEQEEIFKEHRWEAAYQNYENVFVRDQDEENTAAGISETHYIICKWYVTYFQSLHLL